MPRLLVLSLVILSACSSSNISVARTPAAVSGVCNRQSLGAPNSENTPLNQYNLKRTTAINQLFQVQLEKLRVKSSEPSLKERLLQLEAKAQSISSSTLNPWDEPNVVTYKLHSALEAYLADMVVEEKANKLSPDELKKLKYVRESLAPNLSRLEYWIPDFCQSDLGKSSSEIFKGL